MTRPGEGPWLARSALVLLGASTALAGCAAARVLTVVLGGAFAERLGGWPRILASCLLAGAVVAAVVAPRARVRPGAWLARALGLAVAVGLATFVAEEGRSVTRQFSPDSFEVRRVVEWRVPVLDWRLARVREERRRAPIAAYLAEHGLARRRAGEDARWHLVSSLGPCGLHRSGFAGPFSREVSSPLSLVVREGWVAWSRAHPERAAALWPAVVRAAQGGSYGEARALLRAAGERFP